MIPNPGDNFSPAGAASWLQVSEATIWRLIKAGELESFRAGGRRLISIDT